MPFFDALFFGVVALGENICGLQNVRDCLRHDYWMAEVKAKEVLSEVE